MLNAGEDISPPGDAAACQDESSSPSRSPSRARPWSRQAADEVVMNPDDRVLSPEELRAGVAGCDAVLCLLTDRIDASVLEAARGCRVFANMAVGYNNIDVEAAGQAGHPGDQHPGGAHRGDGRPDLDPAPGRGAPGRRGGRRDALGAVPRLGAVLHAGGRRHRPDARPDRAGADRAGRGASAAAGFGMKILYHGRRPSPELDALGGRRGRARPAPGRERLRQPARPALRRDPPPDRRPGTRR